jgi:putative pyruvate formate lyase activating enzyme
LLRGLVDIYLPDFKYFSPELSAKYSRAEDYRERAEEALLFMYDMLGRAEFDSDGMMRKGIIVRHLVLPGQRKDSIACLRRLAEILPAGDIRLSLMSQYTPDFALDTPYKELHRRLTSFEYSSVVKEAEKLGFDGFIQSKSSANAHYTPNF